MSRRRGHPVWSHPLMLWSWWTPLPYIAISVEATKRLVARELTAKARAAAGPEAFASADPDEVN